jgi:hypothetical protein
LNGSIEREKTINKINLTFETTYQLENWKVIQSSNKIQKEEEQLIKNQILNLKENQIELVLEF